jgi:uncharacterized protein YcbK (DUF882 family)
MVLFLLAGCFSTGIASYPQKPQNASSPTTNILSFHGLSKTKPDQMLSRSIVLSHPESGERLSVKYFQHSRYDTKALKKIDWLFRDRHVNKAGRIDPELIDYLLDLRTRLGLPPIVVFEILSGYRTRATNLWLARRNSNVAQESFHMRGYAVDFRIAGVNGRAIAEIAKTMQRGGVAYYPSDNHLHIDLGNIRSWRDRRG